MACSFPTYSDISGADIMAMVAPRASLGAYTAKVIDRDKTLNAENSVIGLCVDQFNSWFTQQGITIADVSAEDCTKAQTALKLYIAGQYLEQDKILNDCLEGPGGKDESEPHGDAGYLYQLACAILKDTNGADISAVAGFCTYGSSVLDSVYGAEGFSKCAPGDGSAGYAGSYSTGVSAGKAECLSLVEGDLRYYTKGQVDSLIAGISVSGGGVSDHGLLTGRDDDDHTQYFNQARGDARYSQLGHTHSYTNLTDKPTIPTDTDDISEATNLYYTDARVQTFGDGRYSQLGHVHSYASLTGKPTIPSDTDDISEASNLYYTDERVDDRVNALLQAGSNITLTYNDVANTLTVAASGGGGSPGGVNTQIQFNNSGAFAGSADLTFDDTNNILTVNGRARVEGLSLEGDSSISYTPASGYATIDYVDFPNDSLWLKNSSGDEFRIKFQNPVYADEDADFDIGVNEAFQVYIIDTDTADVTITLDGFIGADLEAEFYNDGTNDIILDPGTFGTIKSPRLTFAQDEGARLYFRSSQDTWYVFPTSFLEGVATGDDYTVSNVTTDRAFDADSTTLAEVADVLGTLISDLIDQRVLK